MLRINILFFWIPDLDCRHGVTQCMQRMLESAIQFDELKNWSIYQDNDGKYTFKIRFVPRKVSHIDSTERTPVETNHMISYKRKSDKQLNRDRRRVEKRKRIASSEAENSIESVRQGETSTIQDPNVLENQFSPCIFEPNDLPPVNEDIHHEDDLDLDNLLEKFIDVNHSDSELGLNSTAACAADSTSLDVPDDLFVNDAGTANSIPESGALGELINVVNRLQSDRNFMNHMMRDLMSAVHPDYGPPPEKS